MVWGFGSQGFGVYSKPHKKLETGLWPNSAGIPYTLLLRIEAMGFPSFGLLLYGVDVFGVWGSKPRIWG